MYYKMITFVTTDQVKSENGTLQPVSEPHLFLLPKGNYYCPDFHPLVLLFVIFTQMETMLHWGFFFSKDLIIYPLETQGESET